MAQGAGRQRLLFRGHAVGARLAELDIHPREIYYFAGIIIPEDYGFERSMALEHLMQFILLLWCRIAMYF